MTNLHSQLAAANAALAAGDHQGARPLLMQVVRGNPTDGEAWYLLRQTLDDPSQIADCDRRIVALGYHPPVLSPTPASPVTAPALVEMAAIAHAEIIPIAIPAPVEMVAVAPMETAPIAIRTEMANVAPIETAPVPFTLPVVEREPQAAATASAPESAAGHLEAPDNSVGSFSWVWIGLVVGMALVCVGIVASLLRGGTTGIVTAPEGTWTQVTYITKHGPDETQTDFVRVQRSSYTRNRQRIRLTVIWDVRNTSTETVKYAGDNKYIVDGDGNLYTPTVVHPDYRLDGRHQSYPMTLVYDLPATLDTTDLIWGRYDDLLEAMTYAIRLNPTEQAAQRQ